MKKLLAVTIILLFLSVSVIPSTGTLMMQNETLTELIIEGPTHGYVGESLFYGFLLTDQEECDIWYYADWGDGTFWGWYGPVPSGIKIYTSHTWDKVGNYTISAKAKDCEGSIYNATFEVTINKLGPEPPTVEIVNPRKGYLHLSGIPLFPIIFYMYPDTRLLGGFKRKPIQVNATDGGPDGDPLMVWLFINGEDKGLGTWNPETKYYEWQWTGWALGTYTLEVVARDEFGAYSDWASITIWNFCFLP